MKKKPAKANVVDGKWGMGKWRWLQSSPDRKKVAAIVKKMNPKPAKKGFFGQFYEREELPPCPKGYVLIQKKHLDEAVKAIRVALASCAGCWSLGLKDIKLLEQALKNISVK